MRTTTIKNNPVHPLILKIVVQILTHLTKLDLYGTK